MQGENHAVKVVWKMEDTAKCCVFDFYYNWIMLQWNDDIVPYFKFCRIEGQKVKQAKIIQTWDYL